MINISELSPRQRQILNASIILASVVICLILTPTRLPGMELLGIGPYWLLIWVVSWSVKRNIFQAAIAGIALGLIQDGMTATSPSHVLSLTVVGVLTAKIQKQRYIQEDFISIALIVFVMVIVSEAVTAMQYSLEGIFKLEEIWLHHQQITLASAILSSLWAPVVYSPLNRWWEKLQAMEQ